MSNSAKAGAMLVIKVFFLLTLISVNGKPTVGYNGSVYDSLEKCKNAIVIQENIMSGRIEQLTKQAYWLESHCIEYNKFPVDTPT